MASTKLRRSIDRDTPLLPELVAETVVSGACTELDADLDADLPKRLAEQAEKTYRLDDGFGAYRLARRHLCRGLRVPLRCPDSSGRLARSLRRALGPFRPDLLP